MLLIEDRKQKVLELDLIISKSNSYLLQVALRPVSTECINRKYN